VPTYFKQDLLLVVIYQSNAMAPSSTPTLAFFLLLAACPLFVHAFTIDETLARMQAIIGKHGTAELYTANVTAVRETLMDDFYIFFYPTWHGAAGKENAINFYLANLIGKYPPVPDFVCSFFMPFVFDPINQMVVANEVCNFTHTARIDWLLPGIEPTNKFVSWVWMINFWVNVTENKVQGEFVSWDMGQLLKQVGITNRRYDIDWVAANNRVMNPKTVFTPPFVTGTTNFPWIYDCDDDNSHGGHGGGDSGHGGGHGGGH